MKPRAHVLIALGLTLASPTSWPTSSPRPARRRDDVAPARNRSAPADPVRTIHALTQAWLETSTEDDEALAQLTRDALARLTDANVAAIVRALSADELRTPFGHAAFARWLAVDPCAAARWDAANADLSAERTAAIARALVREPRLRLDASGWPDSPWQQSVLRAAALAALEREPELALTFAAPLHAGPESTDVWQTIAYDGISRDPDRALAWIARVADPAVRESLLAVAAKAVAASDPDLGAAWLATAVKSPSLWTETAPCIAAAWAAQSPIAAAEWVSRFPPGAAREAAAEIVGQAWSQTDATAAAAWRARLSVL